MTQKESLWIGAVLVLVALVDASLLLFGPAWWGKFPLTVGAVIGATVGISMRTKKKS
jgi:hypothetical protein